MRTLLVLVLASAAYADTISFQGLNTGGALPDGRHLGHSGTLSIAAFNPGLGTLNSITLNYGVAGSLRWETLSRQWSSSYSDFDVTTQFSFLGVNAIHRESPVLGSGGQACNIPSAPQSCYPADSNISQAYAASAQGAISEGASSVGTYQFRTTFSGALPNSLEPFIGNTPLILPFAYSIDAFPSNPNGAVFGGLLGPQGITFSAGLTYNFTPPVVAHTPEPRYAGMLLGLVLVGYAYRKRLLKHV